MMDRKIANTENDTAVSKYIEVEDHVDEALPSQYKWKLETYSSFGRCVVKAHQSFLTAVSSIDPFLSQMLPDLAGAVKLQIGIQSRFNVWGSGCVRDVFTCSTKSDCGTGQHAANSLLFT